MGVVVCLVMRWAWPGWCSGLGLVFVGGVRGQWGMVVRGGGLVVRGW